MPSITPTRRQLIAGTAAGALTVPFAASSAQAKPHRAQFETVGIDNALRTLIRDGAVGATASVVGRGGTHLGAAGVRSREDGKAHPQDRVRIGSVTKGMVAVLVMQLIESGQWNLRTTIDQVTPGLYPGRGAVTVSQLMNHTSGIPDGLALLTQNAPPQGVTSAFLKSFISRYYPKRELVWLSRQLPWSFEPGTKHEYSNAGYVVLSIMLEEATGVPLQDLLRDRVFKPAGMHHSRLEDSPRVRGPLLVPHAYLADGLVPVPRENPSLYSGAGGAYSTAQDMTSFTGALMTGRLLSQKLVDVMVTPVGAAQAANYGYGLFKVPGPCPTASGTPETLIGHNGVSIGTQSLSFTTRDGSRRGAVAWTGRPYLPTGPMPDGNSVVVAGFSATCSAAEPHS